MWGAGCATAPRPAIHKELEIVEKYEDTRPREADYSDSAIPARELIRIGLLVEVDKVTVSCEGPIRATRSDRTVEEWPAGEHTLSARGSDVAVGGDSKGAYLRLLPARAGDRLKIKNTFRGFLLVKVVGPGKLNVINELGIDDYLKGVLPREVVAGWPDECLRAQAVASRTYLAAKLGRHGKDGFDLCADVHCQVYGGATREHPSTSDAVDATSREIMMYDGKPVSAYFHSNCGGMTEDVARVWGLSPHSYLGRHKCSYGTGDPRYHWKIILGDDEILSALRKSTRVKGTRLRSISVKVKSPSGRAQTVTVRTDVDNYDLSGNEFRIALNPEKIRSTLWTNLSRRNNAYKFEGRGWGHGVGMCQWGAKGLAERGKNYRDILRFYYPHVGFATWHR